VVPHQDSTFLYTKPLSVNAYWLAIEDANVQNGCLWVLPKSHHEKVTKRFIRNPDNASVSFIPTEDAECEEELTKPSTEKWDLDAFVPVEVPSGTLVIMHGSLVHFSKPNTSEKSRHAYTLHIIEKDYEYPPDNWLLKTETCTPLA